MRITLPDTWKSRESASDAEVLVRSPVPEWLDCDGTGGYASSTILNVPTRKYHGLLVANLPLPACGRHVLLAGSIEEVWVSAGESTLLSGYLTRGSQRGGTQPLLPRAADSFTPDPVPTWVWGIGPFRIRRRVFVLSGDRTVVIEYDRRDREHVGLTIGFRPLLAWRRNHDLSRANSFLRPSAEATPDVVRLRPYDGMPPLAVSCTDWTWTPGPHWVRAWYPEEEARGYPAEEDLFVPGELEGVLSNRGVLRLVMSARDDGSLPPDARIAEELRARGERLRNARTFAASHAPAAPPEGKRVLARLSLAAGDFLIRTPEKRPTVQAGYHWFEDWGRDTFIALPGLTFARGHLDEGWRIVRTFLAFEQNGLLPNFIGPPGSPPAYNSVDAALWAFWTVQQYLAWGGEAETVRREAWPVLARMLRELAVGAPGPAFGIEMTSDGLLRAGTPDTQLTWMDAVVDGRPVTPRHGLAVEVCALWYNALRFAERFAQFIGDTTFVPPAPPDRVREAFLDTFVLPDGSGLADTVTDSGVDASVRPNQVIACALPESPVDRTVARRVLDTVRRELWTPCGLRTLSPRSPDYRGRCTGPPAERDAAYHQGTVWPWLLGPFWEAELKWTDRAPRTRAMVRREIARQRKHLREAGIGSVSEIFDGDPPHTPRGCIAQAWSVAELLRLGILVEKGPLPCGYC